MRYEEYAGYASEITQLEALLDGMPEERFIERMGLEHRLSVAKERIAGVPVPEVPQKVYVTFGGEPVHEASGIDIQFGAHAMGLFSDALAMTAAGFAGELKSTGGVPGRGKGQPLITGVTTGSFGFELELPAVEGEDEAIQGIDSYVPEAVRTVQELLTLSSEGTDTDLSGVADGMHPRAVKKVGEFLDLMKRKKARFAMDFEGREFRIQTNRQLETTAVRLAALSVREETRSVPGTLIGVIPASRRFQLNRLEDGVVIEGELGHEIGDAYELAREYTNRLVAAEIRSARVGRKRPKHTLLGVSEPPETSW